MADKTINFNLTKPSPEDFYDINVPNGNMDIIDGELKTLNDTMKTIGDNLVSLEGEKNLLTERTGALEYHLDNHTTESNPHKITPSTIGLGNVPNVATNDQTPTYTEASTLETLTSGEKLNVAFGKIKKAITNLISHIANTTMHITSAERTAWNGKAPIAHANEGSTYGVGTATKYGHLKITDSINTTSSDTAASASALKLVSDKLNSQGYELIKTQSIPIPTQSTASSQTVTANIPITGIDFTDYSDVLLVFNGSMTMTDLDLQSFSHARYARLHLYVTGESVTRGLWSVTNAYTTKQPSKTFTFENILCHIKHRSLIGSTSWDLQSPLGVTSSEGFYMEDSTSNFYRTRDLTKNEFGVQFQAESPNRGLTASADVVVDIYGKRDFV